MGNTPENANVEEDCFTAKTLLNVTQFTGLLKPNQQYRQNFAATKMHKPPNYRVESQNTGLMVPSVPGAEFSLVLSPDGPKGRVGGVGQGKL